MIKYGSSDCLYFEISHRRPHFSPKPTSYRRPCLPTAEMSDMCTCREYTSVISSSTASSRTDVIAALLGRAALIFPSHSNTAFHLCGKESIVERTKAQAGESPYYPIYCQQLQTVTGQALVQGEWANTKEGAEKSIEKVLEVILSGDYEVEFPVRAIDMSVFSAHCSVCGKSREML